MAFFSIESIGHQTKRQYYSSLSKPLEVDTYPGVGVFLAANLLQNRRYLLYWYHKSNHTENLAVLTLA